MSSSSVLVSYAAPQSFLSSQWPSFREGLLTQLPLRTLHWKPPTGSSVRTIQELFLELTPFETAHDSTASQIPSNLLAKPLLNLYFVSCEDGDNYKSVVRKQVKDWHTLVTQRKNQEWLIVQVVRSDAKTAQAGFFQRGNVLDRLKADFNSEKRDRCVQLAWPISSTNPAAWAELLSKIKDGVLSSFDAAVTLRDDEVRRSESQRFMPGWNYCTFFLLKESLALSYERMNLVDDALRQYEELEISFVHVLKEKNYSWFGMLIVPSPRDDSTPLLSLDRKPYHDLILASTVSVFDLQIYMLARQSALLARIGKLPEICKKTLRFLVSFGRQLWDAENILPAYFIESWTYSSALSVVDQIEAWAIGTTLDETTKSILNACTAELIELARSQLDILGVSVGHLPVVPPFTLPISQNRPTPNTVDKRASRTITQPQLMSSLHDKEAFYDLYTSLTNSAIELYAKSGRRKFALKLHGSLAALDVHRGNVDAALQTYSSLPAHYSPHKWASLEFYMLTRAFDLHSNMESPMDERWINLSLSFLRSYIGGLGVDIIQPDYDLLARVERIVEILRDVVIESDFEHPAEPVLTSRLLSSTALLAGNEDGCHLDLEVTNHLRCALHVDSIRVYLAGRDSERLEFSANETALEPGSNKVTIFCPTSSWGLYTLDKSTIQYGRIHFTHEYYSESKSRSRIRKTFPPLVHLERDPQALDIRTIRPRLVSIGMPPCLLLSIATGRNHISSVTINLESPSDVQIRCREARFESEDANMTLKANESSITLMDIPEKRTVSILIPHADASNYTTIQINISASYGTKSQPNILRSLNLSSRIPTSLPIRVNVEDFFRGPQLFSKFTISTTTAQYIRLASVVLETVGGGKDDPNLSGTLPQTRSITTITPSQPANVLFKINAKMASETDRLQIRIRYRMLRDEVESLLEDTISTVLAAKEDSDSHRSRIHARLVEALESDPAWVQVYILTGELHAPSIKADSESDVLVVAVLEALQHSKPVGLDHGVWREVRMPVDLPSMGVVAAVRLSILPSPFAKAAEPVHKLPPIYAGQPIPALLEIHVSQRWAPRDDVNKSYRLRFDFMELVRDWLISGRKRGEFEIQDGGTFSTQVTLIPLHHGELPLPRVLVEPVSTLSDEPGEETHSNPSCETHQVYGAQVILVLPRGGRGTYVVDMGEGSS